MKTLLVIALSLAWLAPAHAAVSLAVSQKSGAAVLEQASRLAGRIGNGLKDQVSVVELPDHGQVEDWLNRFATADLALFEANHVAGKPGQFVVIAPAGQGLTLVGRRGIEGDLPQRIAALLSRDGAPVPTPVIERVEPAATRRSPALTAPPAESKFNPSKSIEEDRYFVSYVYREKLNRKPDAERLEYWAGQLHNGVLTKRQLFEMACAPEEKSCDFR